MLDLFCIAITVFLFAAGAWFVRGCEKLERDEQ